MVLGVTILLKITSYIKKLLNYSIIAGEAHSKMGLSWAGKGVVSPKKEFKGMEEQDKLIGSVPKVISMWSLGNCIYTHINQLSVIYKLRCKSMQTEEQVI